MGLPCTILLRPSGRNPHSAVTTALCGLFCTWLGLIAVSTAVAADERLPANAIEVRDVYFRVKESADVPALERGQLKRIQVEPGDNIVTSQVLAEIDDDEAKLNLELVRIDLAIAQKQHRESLAVSIATATLTEAQELLSQAKHDAEASKVLASADIGIRQATKDGELSKTELERALNARREFSSSVSDQQLLKLTLARDHDLLKLEKSQLEQSIDKLKSQSREATVAQQVAAVQRLQHAVDKAEGENETEVLNLNSLEKQVEIAEVRLERRKLKAPFKGVVVERLKHIGEWVETGETVLRIVQMDELSVEGYVNAVQVTPECRGSRVLVAWEATETTSRIEGVLVFVSPEIDSVSQQVLVRATIQNPGLLLRPGQPAQMWIAPK